MKCHPSTRPTTEEYRLVTPPFALSDRQSKSLRFLLFLSDAETGVPANGDEHPGTSEKVAEGGGGGGGCVCVPRCLSDSPFWIKAVIILGLALLVGAAVLVAVAAGMQQEEGGGNGGGGNVVEGSQVGNEDPIEPTILATSPPTAAPSLSPKPSVMPFPGQNEAPTEAPTVPRERSMPSPCCYGDNRQKIQVRLPISSPFMPLQDDSKERIWKI